MSQTASLEWHGCEKDSYLSPSQQHFISRLNSIYDLIESLPSAFLDRAIQKSLSIKCEELKLTENGLYNDPKPEPYFFKPAVPVNEYPPSFKPGGEYSKHQQSVYEEIREYEDNPRRSHQAAYRLAYEMIWTLSAYQRSGPERIDDDLSALTDWLPVGDFDEDAVLAERFTTLSCPTVAPRDTRDRLHLMFVMRHDIEPQGEDLLREVLAIAAAMIT